MKGAKNKLSKTESAPQKVLKAEEVYAMTRTPWSAEKKISQKTVLKAWPLPWVSNS